MAILQYKIREKPVLELEFLLSLSEFYSRETKWIKAKITFKFFTGFPEISIERSGQEIENIEQFIGDLREITKENISRKQKEIIDFYPLEPDYRITVTREGSAYEILVVLDATGAKGLGIYCGAGPALRMSTDATSLRAFTDDLKKELDEIKQIGKRSE